MPYLIKALRSTGATSHNARTEEAALKLMDRFYFSDIAYQGFDGEGRAIDENMLTDIIDARGQAGA